uniref:C-type lectin domain-containing protein n=1 Tax=Oreochromis aureus TaxID=47969 RepID=A0A668SHS3_OREAU
MKLLVVSALLCGLMVLTTAAPNSHLVKRSTDCPPGWTRISDRCFYYVPTVMSWARAERNCLSMGANLASVHSLSEYQTIQSLTAHYGYPELGLEGLMHPRKVFGCGVMGQVFTIHTGAQESPIMFLTISIVFR